MPSNVLQVAALKKIANKIVSNEHYKIRRGCDRDPRCVGILIRNHPLWNIYTCQRCREDAVWRRKWVTYWPGTGKYRRMRKHPVTNREKLAETGAELKEWVSAPFKPRRKFSWELARCSSQPTTPWATADDVAIFSDHYRSGYRRGFDLGVAIGRVAGLKEAKEVFDREAQEAAAAELYEELAVEAEEARHAEEEKKAQEPEEVVHRPWPDESFPLEDIIARHLVERVNSEIVELDGTMVTPTFTWTPWLHNWWKETDRERITREENRKVVESNPIMTAHESFISTPH